MNLGFSVTYNGRDCFPPRFARGCDLLVRNGQFFSFFIALQGSFLHRALYRSPIFYLLIPSRLLKNAHLLRCAHHALLRRTRKHAAVSASNHRLWRQRQKATWHFVPLNAPCRGIQATRSAGGCWLRMISRALHLSIFEQPAFIDFFNNLLDFF